eukprot:CAMPEP_0178441208 /NCGR_PEP_ID=MMETSP0689_2-20121128/37337_1 /TAXON_ID=160604 /ORGANISM="Amphidinium massartii, Strain CS-259" /LENGTH=392 /DNA_ID=CAMNT_0020064329 /DNA_START=35 /DNA_END=1209 /DNA_ORIENTATION=-
MSFRVAQFNILGRHMAGTMWFHYARDFLPSTITPWYLDWTRYDGFPRSLLWNSDDGVGRFYRFPVLLSEIRALRADIVCLVELDCFQEFRDALGKDGYDAVFEQRPGRADGCGIFWKRESFTEVAPQQRLVYAQPARDRIAAATRLKHLQSQHELVVVSTHLHWDQVAGHQLSETEELIDFVGKVTTPTMEHRKPAALICGDLNTLPGSSAYLKLQKHFQDAAVSDVDGTGTTSYPEDAFTSLKPDVCYFARPRKQSQAADGESGDKKHTHEKWEEWHLTRGRREILDYVFYDPETLEVESKVELPCVPSTTKLKEGGPQAARGFWTGTWAFSSTLQEDVDRQRYNWRWRPKRKRGQLQLGIPNRIHGSDHMPVSCTLRFRDVGPRVEASRP